MKHEIFDTVINVSDSNVTFEQIYKKEYIPVEYIDDIILNYVNLISL